MKIYFDRDSKSVSMAIHCFDGWIDFRLHKTLALHFRLWRKAKVGFACFGPVMVSVGW
ncbi:hypothetical protein [Marinobacter sp. OP 3.4]|uniref:hypothetical protein n=1 Tax=Marinobacter sp. OP 3.4 TaxID=3076501 RepID=UPI002E24B5C9